MQSSTSKETRARIMAAFLKLAIERGIDSTTTRAIAQEAGVSELTLFRHFGDKATLMKEALRETVPSPRLMYDLPVFDASTPEGAVEGLTSCLRFLRDQLLKRQDLLGFAIVESRRRPEIRGLMKDLMAGPRQATSQLLESTLERAAPQLSPGIDRQAAVLSLEGLVLLTVLWNSMEWIELDIPEWDALFASAVRMLLKTPET